MTPIGRGQRELIIGDRKTGKTTVAIDTILNQKGQGVKCIYVGDRPEGLDGGADGRARSRSTARSSTPSSSTRRPPTKPCSSTSPPTPAARWASTGWRTASTRSSSTTTCPSRPRRTASSRCCCAARRAARRTPATSSTSTAACSSAPRSSTTTLGAGSLTALPIIETKAGDVSAYIPTNVISITDGQIYLAGRPVQVGRAACGRRGHLGVPSRWRGADQGDEGRRRHVEARPRAVPRARGVRRRSAPSSTRCRRASSSAATAWSSS